MKKKKKLEVSSPGIEPAPQLLLAQKVIASYHLAMPQLHLGTVVLQPAVIFLRNTLRFVNVQ